jgi:hypothetical protein
LRAPEFGVLERHVDVSEGEFLDPEPKSEDFA